MNSNNEISILPSEEKKILVPNLDTLKKEEFEKLKTNLSENFRTLESNYKELDIISTPIECNEYLWGLIKSVNTEKSLTNILGCVQKLAEHTLNAFEANRDNLLAILELFKMSVDIENDLYTQLENVDCSKESIANLLHDLCLQYNIDNQAIEGLFEQSFKRTITLRNRITDLRQELLLRISKYEVQFEHLDEMIKKKEDDFVRNFDNKATEYYRQLESCIKEYSIAIDHFNEELLIVRNSYKQDFESTKKSLIDSTCNIIGSLEQDINEEIAQLQSNNETLLERVQNLEKAINKKSFLDTMWYKASVGVTALVALGISIFSVL